jgi:sulfopyruvate decarboxylase TPP-binding subunit
LNAGHGFYTNSLNRIMKTDKELITSLKKHQGSIEENIKAQSLQDKTGATAEQIRRAIELLGFDREKVEQYLVGKRRQV